MLGDRERRERDRRHVRGPLGDQSAQVRGADAVDVFLGPEFSDRLVEVEWSRQRMLQQNGVDRGIRI
jgi:hypothetical protein